MTSYIPTRTELTRTELTLGLTSPVTVLMTSFPVYSSTNVVCSWGLLSI